MAIQNSSNISESSVLRDGFTNTYILQLSILAALICFVNLMVIILFASRESLRTKTNTILVSLAWSDMLNGLLVIPLQIRVNVHISEQSLRLASMVLYRFIAVSTMLHILSVTLERHICILSPLRYHSLVTKSRVCKTLVFIWIISTLNSMIPLCFLALIDEDFDHLRQPDIHNSKLLRFELAYILVTVLLFFLTPLVIMTYSFTKILREISRHNRRDSELMLDPSPRSSNSTEVSEETENRTNQLHRFDRKPVLIFLAMFLVFAITWSSWYCQTMILLVSPRHYKPVGGRWPGFARSSTSVINPLLYSLLKKDFRQALGSWLSQMKNFLISRKTTAT